MQNLIILNDYMVLVKKFKNEEILKAVASVAVQSLPEEKKGMIDARWTKDGSIEVYFLEYNTTQEPS